MNRWQFIDEMDTPATNHQKHLKKRKDIKDFIRLGAPVLPPQSAPGRPADTVGATGSTTDSSGGGDFSRWKRRPWKLTASHSVWTCLDSWFDMFDDLLLFDTMRYICFMVNLKLIGKIMWHQQCKFGMEWDRNWSFNVCVTQEFFGLVAMISFGTRLMLMINWHPLPVSKHNAYPVLYKMKSFRSFLLAYFWKSQH